MRITLVVLAACGHPVTNAPDAAPAPHEERILFIRPVGTQNGPFPTGDIYSVRPDGTDEQRITTEGDLGFASWSRDGAHVVFGSPRSGRAEIWIMAADGTQQTQLTHGGAVAPSFAPDGTIVFTADDPGHFAGVFTMASDGTDQRLLRHDGAFASFSADGARIVFTGKVAGADRVHNEIFVMNADGSNEHQVTLTDDARHPDANASSFSPDGTQIAFFCGFEGDLPADQLNPHYEAGDQQVCVANVDGSQRHVLTACTRCGSDNPGWSRDGKQIFFDRGDFDVAGVRTFVIDIDGAHEHQLLDVSYGGGRLPWL